VENTIESTCYDNQQITFRDSPMNQKVINEINSTAKFLREGKSRKAKSRDENGLKKKKQQKVPEEF
jgi:hypothetical protein